MGEEQLLSRPKETRAAVLVDYQKPLGMDPGPEWLT